MTKCHRNIVVFFFLIAVLSNIGIWRTVRHVQAQWANVPPVPSVAAASMMMLGDSQFAYRVIGLMLQNFGDSGGRHTPLKDYDYERLGAWFMLQEALDARSNFTPFLAVFFGASQDPTLIRPVIKYLEVAGNKTEGEKWRWLAHATYLARYRLKDTSLGYQIAVKLANLPNKDMPIWTRQMPAYVLNSRGEKEAALEIMLEILKSGAGKLDPTEVNTTVDYICTQILEEKEALNYSLCQRPPHSAQGKQ